MNRIQFSLQFPNIPTSRLAEFKRLAAQALEMTESEPGALQYDWFFSEDETVCVVRETYADSAAVLAHIEHLGELLPKLLDAAGGCAVEVFGNRSRELRDATAGMRVVAFSYFQGKEKYSA